MKFAIAWAKIAAQNVTLKLATTVLAFIALIQLIVITQLALKSPIVVERGCITRIANTKTTEHTSDEIKAFLTEALPIRFDTGAIVKPNFLSLEEENARLNEQMLLKQKQMSQKLIIYEMLIAEKEILITADRLIAIGKVHSALAFPLRVAIQSIDRSESNPYGLVLTEVNQIEEKKE